MDIYTHGIILFIVVPLIVVVFLLYNIYKSLRSKDKIVINSIDNKNTKTIHERKKKMDEQLKQQIYTQHNDIALIELALLSAKAKLFFNENFLKKAHNEENITQVDVAINQLQNAVEQYKTAVRLRNESQQ